MATALEQELDLTYYPAQPPRMTDPRFFPPPESSTGLVGEATLPLDEVVDPDFPWQILPHDSPGGKKRVADIKARKAATVAGYRLRHERLWRQFRAPLSVASPRTETFSYTVGRTRAQKTTVEAGVEVELGLSKGAFSASMKGSLKWTNEVEQTFSETETKTVEQQFEADCLYLYWQTIDVLTVYRESKEAPGKLVEAKRTEAPSGLIMVDKYQRANFRAPGPLLGAGKVTLHPGDGHGFGGYVFDTTKVTVKNPSSNDDGELTLVWFGIGSKVIITVPPGETKAHKQWLPASFRAIDSGVTDLQVWTDT